jgi:hypothetical protein
VDVNITKLYMHCKLDTQISRNGVSFYTIIRELVKNKMCCDLLPFERFNCFPIGYACGTWHNSGLVMFDSSNYTMYCLVYTYLVRFGAPVIVHEPLCTFSFEELVFLTGGYIPVMY